MSLGHLALLVFLAGGCGRYDRPDIQQAKPQVQADTEHPHKTGLLGGVISSFGQDQFHAEALLESNGTLVVYILGADETQLHPIEMQDLTAYIRREQDDNAVAVLLTPAPMRSDPKDMTTRFSAAIPDSFAASPFYLAAPGLVIGDERYVLRFAVNTEPEAVKTESRPEMPQPISDDQATQLYLKAGGLYTQEDIEANGYQTAAKKYANFRPKHDPNPEPGDAICPITNTLANRECSWIIDGKKYYFCCPPCIDEFLELAKTKPTLIKSPSEYVR